jgi:hypothetical protein
MNLVLDILGPRTSGPDACFASNTGSIFKPEPGFQTSVESILQILTVSESDGINRGSKTGKGVLSSGENTSSAVFSGFLVSKRTPERIVSRTAFVKIPRGCSSLPKESVAALMELVESRMHAGKLVMVLEKTENEEQRKNWVRSFLMIGFEIGE